MGWNHQLENLFWARNQPTKNRISKPRVFEQNPCQGSHEKKHKNPISLYWLRVTLLSGIPFHGQFQNPRNHQRVGKNVFHPFKTFWPQRTMGFFVLKLKPKKQGNTRSCVNEDTVDDLQIPTLFWFWAPNSLAKIPQKGGRDQLWCSHRKRERSLGGGDASCAREPRIQLIALILMRKMMVMRLVTFVMRLMKFMMMRRRMRSLMMMGLVMRRSIVVYQYAL